MKQPTIFISYSHKDEKEKAKLHSHLQVLKTPGIAHQWTDDEIRGGEEWEHKIIEAIQSADLAILLISVNFLNSEFIMDVEVPALLERQQEQGMILFPIIARDCHWKSHEWLGRMNVRPKNGAPVWPGENVDYTLTKLVEEIADALKQRHSKQGNDTNEYPRRSGFSGYRMDFNFIVSRPLVCFFDNQNQFWAYNSNELNVFNLNRSDPIHRHIMPDERYKNFLERPWHQSLVCSDWHYPCILQ